METATSEFPAVGDRCRTLRLSRQLSRADLCKLADVDKSVLELIEHHNGLPNLRNLMKVCRALDVSADYLLGLTDIQLDGELAPRMLRGWSQLSTKEQELVATMCEILVSENQKVAVG